MEHDLLAQAGTPVRVHTLHAGGNEGLALLLDPAIVDIVRSNGLIPNRDLPKPDRQHRDR